MKVKKPTKPDGISIEVWEYMSDERAVWLTIFNKILNSKKMPNGCRKLN